MLLQHGLMMPHPRQSTGRRGAGASSSSSPAASAAALGGAQMPTLFVPVVFAAIQAGALAPAGGLGLAGSCRVGHEVCGGGVGGGVVGGTAALLSTDRGHDGCRRGGGAALGGGRFVVVVAAVHYPTGFVVGLFGYGGRLLSGGG